MQLIVTQVEIEFGGSKKGSKGGSFWNNFIICGDIKISFCKHLKQKVIGASEKNERKLMNNSNEMKYFLRTAII